MPVLRPVLFAVALLYLALPGHPLALLPGLPLGPLGVAVALAIATWWIGLPGAPPRARALLGALAVLAVVKVGTGSLAPPYGLVAEYRVDGEASPEGSTEWRRSDWTRIDRTLELAGDEFPVHFFNDVRRFNYFRANEPRRDLLPFAARWVGQFWAPRAGRYTFTVESNGPATLSVAGGRAAVEQSGRLRSATFAVELDAGLHPIEASYRRPDETMPWLSVSAGLDGRPSEPLAVPTLVQPAATGDLLRRDGIVRPVALGADAAFLAALALTLAGHVVATWRGRSASASASATLVEDDATGRAAGADADHAGRWTLGERGLLAGYFLAASGLALAGHLHLHGLAVILSGGNDWLAYAGFARDVLIGGPLMTEGRPLGQGVPYYYQPLYIYWLALVHLVAGEGLFAPLLANALLGIVAGLGVYALGRELFGRLAATAALLVFELCRLTFFAPTAGLLLSENLLLPQIPLFLWPLVRALRTTGWRWLALSGVALGLAGLTRTTPLALLPPALLILAVPFKQRGLAWTGVGARLGLVVAACVLTISMATVRNYVVSGRPVPITSSAGANLWEAHRPTDRVDLSRIDREPLYERLGLDRPTREVVEFVRQDPVGYVGTLVPMFLYAVGVVGAISDSWEVHYGLAGMCAVYALTTLFVRQARTWPVLFVHAFVLSHLAQMTIFFSHQYGFRLILPMYVAMAPVVGLGIAAAIRGLGRIPGVDRTASRRVAWLAGAATLLAIGLGATFVGAVQLVAGQSPLGPTARESAARESAARESFYGINGDAALAARQALRPDLMRQADVVFFAGDDSRTMDVAYLPGLAFPSMRWFDGARGLVLPPADTRALYVLPDRAGAAVARRCLGRELTAPTRRDVRVEAALDTVIADRTSTECIDSRQEIGAQFEGTARLLGLDAPATIEPGQPMDVTLRWEPLQRPQNRARPFVRLVDSKGRAWGQTAESAVYPSSSWRPGELVVGIARLTVDPTLPPGDYGLEVGVTNGSSPARLVTSGTWGQQGQPDALGGSVRLVSRSTPLPPDLLPVETVRDERLDGVRFLGATLDRDAPEPGERVRLSLFWQNAAVRLADQEVSLVLRDGGSVIHEWRGAPVDGTYPTSLWKPAEVVRDTWDLVVPATLPGGSLELAVGLARPAERPEQYVALTTLTVQPVARQLDEPSVKTRQDAQFGDVARLVGFDLKNRRVKPGDTADLTLVWQAMAETRDNYVVSISLLGEGDRPVARSDEEPAGGKRPTAGWAVGEYVDDGHRVRVPRDAPRGRLKIAVGLLDEEGRLLLDDSGAERVVLQTELVTE